MAINLNFDLLGNPEPLTIVLANRNGNKLGQLDVNTDSIDIVDKLKGASEFTFTINKYIDDKLTILWDKIVDFKLIYCVEWNMWFEIKVELDEATETVKTVFCTQLGQAELSQIMLYNIEINTEKDIERDNYKISILYDKNDPKASILNRILDDKAPHYQIKYVDPAIARIQRSFSFDGSSICDALDNIEEEIGCLVVYDSDSDENGMPSRTISVYDLQQNCLNKDCGHRGEFIDECPKCGSKNIENGYGQDTLIFVTADELASEGIQLVTDTDSAKNCFKLEGGDDLMTATIRNCNPNGTDYIWYFSDDIKEDMSDELVQKIEDYDKEYKESYKTNIYNLDVDLLSKYNALVDKYDNYYNTKSTCLNCEYEEKFYDKCPQCGSENLLLGKSLQSISTPITGYSALMNAYYNTIDLGLYLKSGLMPNVEMSDTNAQEQVALLEEADNLISSPLYSVAVNTENRENISLSTANSAVLSMAKIIVKSTYKVEIKESSLSDDKVWTGKFIVTNYSDDSDIDISENITVIINNDVETFIKQKIDKALNKEDTDDLSVSGLFKKDYEEFCEELKKYALNPLKSFSEACDTCISVLTEQGAGDKDEKPDLHNNLYKPYFDKSMAIIAEIKIREDEIAIIEGVYDKTDENNPRLTEDGLQTNIEDCKKQIQDTLNFEKYLGEELWLEFCLYRREDKYTNDNYISDGLNNAELFQRALEFIDVAENEIYKSSELQHSISTSLNNLLVIPKFKSLVKSFKNGNWIRVQVDDKVYKLRLIEYGFSYNNLNNISVEFSDLTKIKNSTTDVQDIISQASAIATSYDSIKRQSNKGNMAQGTIEQWLENGLNTAKTQIQSNDNEELIITKNGLLGRSYGDIGGDYSPEQFKLTHNMFAYTSDNWETVDTALGKHGYKYWNGTNFVDGIDYGFSTKFVTAGYVTGSQIIGGEIVSSNYVPSGDNRKGTHINLIKGDFDFAGGKMVFNADKNTMTLKDVTIQWDSTNKPEVTVTDVSGLGEYIDQLGQLEEQLDGRVQTYNQTDNPSTSWTVDEKQNHISDLWVNPDDGLTKSWDGNEWVIVTDSELESLAQTKAQIFASQPTAPYYKGDLWVQGSKGDIYHCITTNEDGSFNQAHWALSSKYTDDTSLTTFINGEYADELESIQNSIDKKTETWYQDTDPSVEWTQDEKVVHTDDLWFDTANKKSFIYVEDGDVYSWEEIEAVPDDLYDTVDGKSSVYTSLPDVYSARDLLIPNTDIANGNATYLKGKVYRAIRDSQNDTFNNADWEEINYTDDSALNDFKASEFKSVKEVGDNLVKGLKFQSTEIGDSYVISPSIAGGYLDIYNNDTNSRVTIDPNNMTKSDYIFQVHNGDRTTVGITKDGKASFSGALSVGRKDATDEAYVEITEDGVLTANGAEIIGVITAGDGNIGGFKITKTAIFNRTDSLDSFTDGVYMGFNESGDRYGIRIVGKETDPGTGEEVTNLVHIENGVLNAEGAEIAGHINTRTGSIGGWDVNEESIMSVDGTVGLYSGGANHGSYCETSGSPIRFYAGDTIPVDAPFYVTENGFVKATNADITGGITATSGNFTNCNITDGCTIGNWHIQDDAIFSESASSALPQNNLCGIYSGQDITMPSEAFDDITSPVRFFAGTPTSAGFDGGRWTESYFAVLDDGSLYANAANIKGHIEADSGTFTGTISAQNGDIGGLIINNGITGRNDNNNDTFSLKKEGLIINNSDAKIQVGNFETYYDKENNSTYWITNGALYLEGRESESAITAIELMTDEANEQTVTSRIALYLSNNKTKRTLTAWLNNYSALHRHVTYTIYYQLGRKKINISGSYESWDDAVYSMTLSTTGNTFQIVYFDNDNYATSTPFNYIRFALSSDELTDASSLIIDDITTNENGEDRWLVENVEQKLTRNNIKFVGNLIPKTTNTYQLGNNDNKWSAIYATTLYSDSGQCTGSDRNIKNTIIPLNETYSAIFDQLRPVSYKLNNGESGRTHTGLVAQNVKDVIESVGLTTKDFAAYCEWKKEDGSTTSGLRYGEFISMCIYEIQKLKKRVAELENKD